MPRRSRVPATTPEASENRMISLAIRQAEKQLEEGTAPTQVVVHYLKLASTKNRLEEKRLQRDIELVRAKTEAIEETKHSSELFERAIEAMKGYQGREEDSYEDEYDY